MRAANASGGETHFSVEIVSAEFEGKVRTVLQLAFCGLIMIAEIDTTASHRLAKVAVTLCC